MTNAVCAFCEVEFADQSATDADIDRMEAEALLLWGVGLDDDVVVICDACFQRTTVEALADHHKEHGILCH